MGNWRFIYAHINVVDAHDILQSNTQIDYINVADDY